MSQTISNLTQIPLRFANVASCNQRQSRPCRAVLTFLNMHYADEPSAVRTAARVRVESDGYHLE